MPLSRIETFVPSVDGSLTLPLVMHTVSGALAMCAILESALDKRAARDGREHLPPNQLFEIYRDEIEGAASSAYDAGASPPVVIYGL